MQIGQRQELRQSQSLVMTPHLQQAIKLLQLSNLELTEFVEQELETNPLLERAEPERERGDGAQGESQTSSDEALPDSTAISNDDISLPASEDAPLDVNYNEVYGSEDGPNDRGGPELDISLAGLGGPIQTRGSAGFSDGSNLLEQTVSSEESLLDHLLGQLVDISDPIDRLIGYHLTHLIDEAGYVPADLDSVAEQVGCELARVEATLVRLQNFDPSGVFARNLSECLAIQLRDLDRLDPAMQALLDNLEFLASGDQATLLEKCSVDEEDLIDMIGEIRALDPKPGQAFSHEIAQPVVPDVFVRPASAGGWVVELNSETLPRVLVNTQYYAVVTKGAASREDKSFIAERLNSANWVIKSLEQRATTILKVSTELVRQQDAFFAKGVQHLRPLTLRDIAQAIEMHESTVSRVTANKYLATPRGIYQMKYFFTSAIASATVGAASLSAESVRHRIKELVDQEDAADILSDDKIVDILRGEQVDIARRTVAKYRESMRIPSSVDRRRQLRAASWATR
jgi:RNA polymerase sigma-54 factor